MKYFYLYIIILFCFIIFVSYCNTYYLTFENFNTNKNTLILLGDSILKNNAYVSNGNSIENILLQKTNGKLKCYARDGAKIIDVYKQISEIPLELNNRNTLIFLSAGGNDILFYYVEEGKNISDTTFLDKMFIDYKNLIETIQNRLPKANLYLLDIYYPQNEKYTKYHTIIDKWNNMIYSYANKNINNISGVVKISTILTKNNDISFDIEPSSKGGEKISEHILLYPFY